jgi:phage tail sheath gpL-like
MPISFNQIPAGWKVPLVHIEVDPSQAGTPTSTKYALLVGYKLASGSAVVDQPIACGSEADARALCGRGSPLALMFSRFFTLNKSTPVFLLPSAEQAEGVAATGNIVVTGAPTASGILALYIANQKVSVGVSAGDAVNAVATKIDAAINAAFDLPVSSTVNAATVALSAKWKGQTGNDIRVETNVLGANGGEVKPAGLALTLPATNVLAGGMGVPTWANAIAALGDEPYEYVALGATDSGTLAAWGLEYGYHR